MQKYKWVLLSTDNSIKKKHVPIQLCPPLRGPAGPGGGPSRAAAVLAALQRAGEFTPPAPPARSSARGLLHLFPVVFLLSSSHAQKYMYDFAASRQSVRASLTHTHTHTHTRV